MFKHQLVPNINLFERIQPTKLDVGSGVDTMRLQRIEKPETQNFKAVFSGLVENLNTQMEAPDNMMDTHHSQMMAQNNCVAASIVLETRTVGKIQGLQITGHIKTAKDSDKTLYIKRFPYTAIADLTLWRLEADFMNRAKTHTPCPHEKGLEKVAVDGGDIAVGSWWFLGRSHRHDPPP